MKRVCVIGCPGAGKSTLSFELSRRTGLPIIHLDKEFWLEGWVESCSEEFRSRVVERFKNEDRWIVDGHYISTMEERLRRADTVFWLDYSTRVCFFRVLLTRAKTGQKESS